MFAAVLICCIVANALAAVGAVGTFIYYRMERK